MTGSPGDSPPPEPVAGPGASAAEFDRTPTDPSVRRQVTPLPGMVPAVDGQLVVKEFALGGLVPRTEQGGERKVSPNDVYVRLENTIYGPLNSDELAAMLASGQFTGYESASSDLQHWTPLLYHPRMNLTGYADPDQTHALLHERSTLPQASRKGTRVRLEDYADGVPEEVVPGVPLAAIMLRPRKQLRRTTRGVELPVFAELKDDPTDVDDVDMFAVTPPMVSPSVRAARDSGPFPNAPVAPVASPVVEPAPQEDLQGVTSAPEAPVATPAPAQASTSGKAADPGFSKLQILLGTIVLTSVLIVVYFFVLR